LSNEVFKPTATTRILASSMNIASEEVVIDMGCGIGYIGILAAKLGSRKVYGVDLAEGACELARKNVVRNRVDSIVEIRQGNLFEPLEGVTADIIVDDVSGIAGLISRNSKSYAHKEIPIASDDGSWPTTEMLQEAPKYLSEKGKLYFPLLSLANEEKIMKSAKKSFKYIDRLTTKTVPLTGEFEENYFNCLKKLHNAGIIRLIQKGSRLCWQLSIFEALNYKER